MSLTRVYSERLGLLTGEQLRAVAEHFELGELLSAEPVPEGLFGQVLFLETSTGSWVFRGNPHAIVQLVTERHAARLIDERSPLPAPWPYRICEDDSLFGWPYAVMPRLRGENGNARRKSLDGAGRMQLARSHGEALSRLHEVTAEAPGHFDWQADAFVPADDHATCVLARFDQWREACRKAGRMTPHDERFVDDVLDANADALHEPMTPVLVHHDFKPGNVLFDGFEPSGIVDFQEVYLGDREEDLVRMLWSVPEPEAFAFVDTYVAQRPLRPGAAQRLSIYALCDWMVIWEYGTRAGVWFGEGDTLRRTAQPVVERARKAAG